MAKNLWSILALASGLLASMDAVYDDNRRIHNFVYNNNGFGIYSFEFATPDGTYRREEGGSSPGTGDLVVRGEYGFIDPTGKRYSVRYVADANGYRPQAEEDTSEDVELRRIFPREFPQDTVRRSGSLDPEHLGRYSELQRYFQYPKAQLNSHFEELECYEKSSKKLCKIDVDRYSPDEDNFYISLAQESNVDRRRVYCMLLLCFTEDELDRVVASF